MRQRKQTQRLHNKYLQTLLGLIGAIGTFFLLMFILTIGNYPVPKTVSDDPAVPHVTINGVIFHAETFGNPTNPVVIVVHGGPGWDYRSLLSLKNLSDEFYVVFYDQRGTGLSPRVDLEREALTLESSLQDLDAIVDRFAKGRKVNLIGHSWGASLVSGYIGKHSKKVSHAILAEPAFLTTEMAEEADISFGPRLDQLDLDFLFRATKVWFQSLHVRSPDEQAASDYFIGQVAPYANSEYFCNRVVPDIVTEHWRAGSLALRSVIRSVTDSEGNIEVDLTEGIDKYINKVLFIAGECNTKIGVKYQRKQMEFFPNSELAVIKGSGHMMFAEKPVESLRIVRGCLQEK